MFLIGIAGGSGSGKTTFAKKVISRLVGDDQSSLSDAAVLLHQDSYYLPSAPSIPTIKGKPNFDHPEAFDWHLLRDHLSRLKQGDCVDTPVYDFSSSRRQAQTLRVGPAKAILLEGIYSLWDSEIRGLFDLKIYLNVEADIRFIRRLHRDVRERGRTLDSIIGQYYDTVRPMHHEYLEPTKQYADLVVGEESDIAADAVAARILQFLRSQADLSLKPESGLRVEAESKISDLRILS